MKTVNIIRKKEEKVVDYMSKLQGLMKELYKLALKDDPKFHFFYEPEVIIRLSDAKVIKKVEEFFKGHKYRTMTYDYPLVKEGYGKDKDGVMRYGEQKNGIVMKHFDLFVTIFHAHSIAAITMSDDDHFQYMERVIHTAYNPRLISRKSEGAALYRMAMMKMS